MKKLLFILVMAVSNFALAITRVDTMKTSGSGGTMNDGGNSSGTLLQGGSCLGTMCMTSFSSKFGGHEV